MEQSQPPASPELQLPPRMIILLNEAAAALQRAEYFRTVFLNKPD
jgi:hypothetical protein